MFTTQEEMVLGTLAMVKAGVNAMVVNSDDDFVPASHSIANAYKV